MNEEVQEEVDALEAIYWEDFGVDGGEQGEQARLRLDVKSSDGDQHVRLVLALPLGYPDDEAARVYVDAREGVTRSQLESLSEELRSRCEGEWLGMPQGFVVAERVKDWLEHQQQESKKQQINEEQRRYDKEMEDKLATQMRVAGAPLITVGDRVTRELFIEWRDKFEAERNERIQKDVIVDPRPTGKQLWLQGKAKASAE